jgi:hypothetical protein
MEATAHMQQDTQEEVVVGDFLAVETVVVAAVDVEEEMEEAAVVVDVNKGR